MGTYVHAEHEVEPDQLEPGLPDDAQAAWHAQDFLLGGASLDLAFAPTEWLALEAQLPLRTALVLARFEDEARKELPGFESIHHRTELLAGPGDPRLSMRVQALRPAGGEGLALSLWGGVTLPVGNIEPDPFALGKKGRTHQHLFFGTGTLNPSAGLDASWRFTSFRVGGSLSGTVPLYENAFGYRAPGDYNLSLYGESAFGLDDVTFRLAPEVHVETPASWSGREAENSGRVDLILGGGVFHQTAPGLETYALVKVSAWTFTFGGQLIAPVLFVAGGSFEAPLR